MKRNLLTSTIVEHHKPTLEAVHLQRCDSLPGSAINRILTECVKLHTISCKVQDDIDCSLMCNLTTLNMNFPSVDMCNGVQHCRRLQSLHLVPPLYDNDAFSHITVDLTASNLQALRTMYTARAYAHNLRLQLPSICVVEEEDGKWYDLFKLPVEVSSQCLLNAGSR